MFWISAEILIIVIREDTQDLKYRIRFGARRKMIVLSGYFSVFYFMFTIF